MIVTRFLARVFHQDMTEGVCLWLVTQPTSSLVGTACHRAGAGCRDLFLIDICIYTHVKSLQPICCARLVRMCVTNQSASCLPPVSVASAWLQKQCKSTAMLQLSLPAMSSTNDVLRLTLQNLAVTRWLPRYLCVTVSYTLSPCSIDGVNEHNSQLASSGPDFYGSAAQYCTA